MTTAGFHRQDPVQRRAIVAAEAIASNRHLAPGDAIDVAGHHYEIAKLSKTYPDGTRSGHPITISTKAMLVDGTAVVTAWKAPFPGYREATAAQREGFMTHVDAIVEGFRAVSHERHPHLVSTSGNLRKQISRALGD